MAGESALAIVACPTTRVGHPYSSDHPVYGVGMVTVAEEVRLAKARPRRPRWPVTMVTVLLVAAVLGYLGWVLPRPGASLVVPTLVVLGVGCVLAVMGLAYWIVSGRGAIALSILATTLVASIWTFEFSLPVAVALDTSATAQAQTALAQLNSSPRSKYGIPLHPCSTKVVGSVGPLRAPYRQCAVSTPEGHFVLYTSGTGTSRGIGFTDIGAATFPDACSRHLIGPWWMFTAPTGGEGQCPVGYSFHGGG